MTHGTGHSYGQSRGDVYEHRPHFINPLTGGWTEGAKWVKWLLIINASIWILMMITFRIWPEPLT